MMTKPVNFTTDPYILGQQTVSLRVPNLPTAFPYIYGKAVGITY